jgi:hypothetical protein
VSISTYGGLIHGGGAYIRGGLYSGGLIVGGLRYMSYFYYEHYNDCRASRHSVI